MVDREARRRYAQLVRQFISGRMTNDEYETCYEAIKCDQKDLVVREVYDQIWFCYDDIRTHKMTGSHRLDAENRRTIAKAVLFLQSESEYQWPKHLWDGSVFLVTAFVAVLVFALLPEVALITRSAIAGVLAAIWLTYERRQARKWEKAGDKEAWPFLHQADLAEAARHPRLLNGGRTMP